MYSDGITEAEDTFDQPFDESGVQTIVDGQQWGSAKELGWALFEAVETHSRERRLLDDLTVLALRRLPPLPLQTVTV
jgi:serine phosphatase RsbU (regulator of sigma subunit)